MSEYGFMDFTDVHATRIRNVSYRYEVSATSLEQLGAAAIGHATLLFGDMSFRIDRMEVDDHLVRAAGDVIQYRASVVAVAE